MKKNFLWGIFISILIFSVFNCSMDSSVSIEERIAMFMQDLDNNAWGNLYKHIHPDNPFRTTAASPTTWYPSPFNNGNSYGIGPISGTGAARTAQITSTDLVHNGDTWTFTMEEGESKVWYIDQLVSNDTGVIIP